uniref:Uncharacterized protein n=1 Tax=Podarcis muralis TaxID=64176 RepID=A0A670JJV5_PODMU
SSITKALGDGGKMNSRAFGSQLKDCIPVSDFSAAGAFESCDVINRGFTNVKSKLFPVHPLDTPDNFVVLQMEFQAVKLLQHFPFLPSSNLSLDIWKGNCDCIGFEDILNDPAQSEGMGDPHLLVEHKLGFL